MANPGVDEVSLLIGFQEFKAWGEMELTTTIDGVATAGFTAPMEPSRSEFRDTFRPFSYTRVDVMIAGSRYFTGYMLDVVPEVEPGSKVVKVTAVSLPGVIEDCTPPGERVPFEWEDLNLRDIATAAGEWFDLDVTFDAEPGANFKKVALEPGQKVHGWLAGLAKQRSLVMTSTPEGGLLFQKSIPAGIPVARLVEGEQPLGKVTPSFKPREYYSELTGFTPKKKHTSGNKSPIQNPRLSDVTRPTTFKLDDTEKGEAADTTSAHMGRMFADVVSYNVPGIPTWRDPQDELWTPNTTITLNAPGAMIYNEFEFLVRQVVLKRTKEEQVASLNVVFPGAFEGEAPDEFPWDLSPDAVF